MAWYDPSPSDASSPITQAFTGNGKPGQYKSPASQFASVGVPYGNNNLFSQAHPTANMVPSIPGANVNGSPLAAMGGGADIGAASSVGPAASGPGGYFLPQNASQNTNLTDPNSTLASSTGSTQGADQFQQQAPASQIDRIMQALGAVNIDPVDYVKGVGDQYSKIFGALNDSVNQQNSVYNQHHTNINDMYAGNYNAALKDAALNTAQRDAQSNSSSALTNNLVKGIQDAQSGVNVEQNNMMNRLNIPVGQQPGMTDNSKLSAQGQDPTAMAVANAQAQGANQQENINAGRSADAALNDSVARSINTDKAGAQTTLDNTLQNNLGAINAQKVSYGAQEAKDMFQAIAQNRADQLNRYQMMFNALQSERDYEQKNALINIGNRGTGYNNAENSSAILNAVKAQVAQGGGQPASQAANIWAQNNGMNPQQVAALNSAFTNAQAKGSGIPGTAATKSDGLSAMLNDPALAGFNNPNMVSSYFDLANQAKAAAVDPNAIDFTQLFNSMGG